MAQWIMQARSSETEALVTWPFDGAEPDWSGEAWPGPGDPEDITLAFRDPSFETVSIASTSTTPVEIRRYPVPTGGVKVLRAVVKCRNADGTKYGEYEVKGAWRRNGGTLSQLYAPLITSVAESDAGLNVTITFDGNDAVLLNGVGLAATNLIWEAQEAFF